MLAAGALDGSAADDALAVGEQHDLEQHGGRVGRSAGFIVAEPRIEARQVDFVIEQMVQRVFDGAGQKLALQVNRE